MIECFLDRSTKYPHLEVDEMGYRRVDDETHGWVEDKAPCQQVRCLAGCISICHFVAHFYDVAVEKRRNR